MRVNRSTKLEVPGWFGHFRDPELQTTGPTTYDVREVVPYLWLPEQESEQVRGHLLYDHLRERGDLHRCLRLADGHAIKELGIDTFTSVFGSSPKVWTLWGSVAFYAPEGEWRVPYLIGTKEHGVQVKWDWLGHDYGAHTPALTFPNH